MSSLVFIFFRGSQPCYFNVKQWNCLKMNWFQTKITCILKWLSNSVLGKQAPVYVRMNFSSNYSMCHYASLFSLKVEFVLGYLQLLLSKLFFKMAPHDIVNLYLVIIVGGGWNGLMMFTALYCSCLLTFLKRVCPRSGLTSFQQWCTGTGLYSFARSSWSVFRYFVSQLNSAILKT